MQAPPRLPLALLRELRAETPFTARELQRLWSRFQALDRDSAGTIAALELKRVKELLYNPFSTRIAEVFSDDGSGRLSFKNFLELFSVFSPSASFDIKVIFLFALWDFDGDDLLGKDDIRRGVKLLLSEPSTPPPADATAMVLNVSEGDSGILTTEQVDQVLARMAAEADPEANGLSFQDFQSILSNPEYLDFTIPI